MTEIALKHNVDAQRYEAWDGDTLAGFAQYGIRDGRVVFPHTEVESAYEGQGVGSKIARFALDDVREQGAGQVVPACPFIKGWIDRHPDYADLVGGPSADSATE